MYVLLKSSNPSSKNWTLVLTFIELKLFFKNIFSISLVKAKFWNRVNPLISVEKLSEKCCASYKTHKKS